MAQAQRIPLRILREVILHRPEITLALEVVRIDDQQTLDKFMAHGLSEEQFLEALEYDRSWGFPWDYYRDLFFFARDHGMRVVGINSEPRKGRGALRRRDRAAARVIAREHVENPERLIYLFDGDLHVASSHLPHEVDLLLADFEIKPETVIVFQNIENIYWKLARHGLEQETDVVLIADGRFCVMSAPPIIKFQSYFNWINNTRELNSPAPPSWRSYFTGDSNLYSQVRELVEMISRFLDIEAKGLDDFVVYSPADLDFLDYLSARDDLAPGEISSIATHIRGNESYFIEKGNIIYIANLSINHAAEEATHFIHKACAGARQDNLDQAEDFYCRVMREAIGFFGSKIVNHKRPCYRAEDFRSLRRKHPGLDPDRIDELRMIGRLLRQHRCREQAFLKKGKLWALEGPIYEQRHRIHIGLTHALGYALGEDLFEGLMKGVISKEAIRDLFFMNFSDLTESFCTYLDLTRTLADAGLRRA
jgi:hypothetical protein